MGLSCTKEWLDRLVAHPTVSKDSNLALVQDVAQYLSDQGAKVELIHNEDKRKANLLAQLGPERESGIVLSGHTDVVPVDGQPWESNPFKVKVEGNKLSGRGVCDMKGFIASALSQLPNNVKDWRRPLWFAFSYDEEVGCVGAPSMISKLESYREIEPALVIVGEPTSLQSIVGHKGIAAAETRVRGYETHSSQLQRGVSAVMVAARLIAKLESLGAELRAAKVDSRFEPEFSTIHVGMIQGGTAINITARDASFVWDVRTIPGQDARSLIEAFQRYTEEEVLPEMLAKHPDCSIHTQVLADAPGLSSPGSQAHRFLMQALGLEADERYVAYATEGGQFQQAGFDTVIWGPGSIDQAHQPNEWISAQDLKACDHHIAKIYRTLKEELSLS